MRASTASSSYTPFETPPALGASASDQIKIDPHKYLIFNYSKESEEWVSLVTLGNNDNECNYIFNIEYNRINDKECFIIRPRKEGLLQKQTGFGRKVVLKITYDPRNDEPSIRHSKEKLGCEKRAEEKMQNLNKFELLKDTRRYFRLQIWKLQPNGRQPLFFRCQYLLPIFFHPQLTNTEVFVYPAKSITFNRNQGNQFSYWKNNFFIINNASQSVYFKILTTRLPNNCDMVIFPTSGVVQHSFSDYTLQKRPTTKASVQPETDQDMSGKHYTIVSILLLDPEKAYLTHMVQKPIATIVMLYSYQKHPETDNLDELLQWATGKETIDIFVRDMSHNVAAKNIVVHDKKMLETAMQNSMDQVYKLENMMYQRSSRLTRNTLTSQKHSRGLTLGSSALFKSSRQGYPSTVMATGNSKDLFSFSSLPDHEPSDEASYVYPLPVAASTPLMTGLCSTGRSQEVSDVIRRVKARISNERRITVTYGVSDSDIRRLIELLQLRGCDASAPSSGR